MIHRRRRGLTTRRCGVLPDDCCTQHTICGVARAAPALQEEPSMALCIVGYPQGDGLVSRSYLPAAAAPRYDLSVAYVRWHLTST
jgi:hypothetical protein